MEFYKVLTEIMAERDLTIPDVARACGLTDSTVRSIITRKSQTVSLEVAFKISSGLGVSLERLGGEPERETRSAAAQIDTIFQQLSEENRSKLTELALLFLSGQHNTQDS